MPTRSWSLFLSLLLTACSTESRLLRITPFRGSGAPDAERVNGWPLLYSDRDATAVLWPLMDFDSHGFAVRPFVSKDDAELDVLFPLSHVDTSSGDGWVLNAYSFGGNRGLFPLCHLGSSFSFVLPVGWWKDETGEVTDWTVFPLAGGDVASGNGWILNAYSYEGNVGLFPLFHFGPALDFVGPVFWSPDHDDGISSWGLFPIAYSGEWGYAGPAWWERSKSAGDEAAYGLFPLFTWSPFRQIGPAWWTKPGDEGSAHFGLFPIVWGERGGDQLLVAPLYYQDLRDRGPDGEPDHARRALLLPPTWWETEGDVERHFVLPFYAHVANAERDFTAWLPLYWSSRAPGRSQQLLVPLWLYREREAERLLLTPLGGWGWDANGTTRFVNFLGPLYHHSVSPTAETTAVAWPLFSTTVTAQGRDTWMAAGLARHVAQGESSSLRLWPLFGVSDAEETPDPLFDLSLVSSHSHGEEWSQHVFPLYAASGEGERSSFSALFGVAHVGSTEAGSSWRLWPLASSSDDPEADGFIDRTTLFRHERRGDVARDWLFPLYTGYRSPDLSSHTALFGLGRAASTPAGSSWRLWPLASGSTDPAADSWFDRATLFRHEQRGDLSRNWLFPLWSSTRGPELVDDDLLLLLARHERTTAGSAWRLWPLFSTTSADGLDDLLDPVTLFGWHPHAEKTHLHVGTSLLFADDRYGPGKRSWDTRVLTFFDVGHQESPPPAAGALESTDPTQPPPPITLERNWAGFLFDWFLVENSVVQTPDGERHDQAHYRLPLLHEYERTAERSEWDLLCWAVHSRKDAQEEKLSVLGYGYRSVKTGEETRRDIFPFITCDTAPQKTRVSFLWRLFRYERDGARTGGHLFFIPWGDPG